MKPFIANCLTSSSENESSITESTEQSFPDELMFENFENNETRQTRSLESSEPDEFYCKDQKQEVETTFTLENSDPDE